MDAVEHTTSFTLNHPIKIVFPLFTPEGEKSWAPGWDYVNILEMTELSEDYAFLTGTHDHASTQAIWLVKRYSPDEGLIAYYRVEPEDKIGVVTVHCSMASANSTEVEVTYKYIPISDKGRKFVEDFSLENYTLFIAEWQTQLKRYFETLD
jgi:hypothetical protein